MANKAQDTPVCCGANKNPVKPEPADRLPMFDPAQANEVCCGPPVAERSSPLERPGYKICPFVDDFTATTLGPVPRIKVQLSFRDRLGTALVRLGIGRNDYKVAPGLYALGSPDPESPVLVTANYKLTFDTLRRKLTDVHAWLLVLDTRGVNVWCAAGKGTFGTEEVIRQVRNTHLEQVIKHRKLILPQLGATGVSALEVKKGCGFEVLWGPIRAADIKPFLANSQKITPAMRALTFTLMERAALTPLEITQTFKQLLWLLPALFILSGFGPEFFSLSALWHRGSIAALAALTAVVNGAFLTPLLLPWIPGRAFSLKGSITALLTGAILVGFLLKPMFWSPVLALFLIAVPISSYLAMNFTGSTPYTSPSGVEKEMRKAIPLQSLSALCGLVLWVVSAFY